MAYSESLFLSLVTMSLLKASKVLLMFAQLVERLGVESGQTLGREKTKESH